MLPRNKGILIRANDEIRKEWQKLKTQKRLKTNAEVLLHLFQITGQGVTIRFQNCQHYSEYPPNFHFIECYKNGKPRRKTREDCRACNHYHEIEVPLSTKAFLEDENQNAQNLLRKTRSEIKEAKTIIQLESQVQELLPFKDENLYLRDQCQNFKDELERFQPPDLEVESYRKDHESCGKDHTEPLPKSVSNFIEQIQKKEPSKKTEKAQTFTRTIEREKTTEREKITEVVEDPLADLEILCKVRTSKFWSHYVPMSFCRKDCKCIPDCPSISEINAGKIPEHADTRTRLKA